MRWCVWHLRVVLVKVVSRNRLLLLSVGLDKVLILVCLGRLLLRNQSVDSFLKLTWLLRRRWLLRQDRRLLCLLCQSNPLSLLRLRRHHWCLLRDLLGHSWDLLLVCSHALLLDALILLCSIQCCDSRLESLGKHRHRGGHTAMEFLLLLLKRHHTFFSSLYYFLGIVDLLKSLFLVLFLWIFKVHVLCLCFQKRWWVSGSSAAVLDWRNMLDVFVSVNWLVFFERQHLAYLLNIINLLQLLLITLYLLLQVLNSFGYLFCDFEVVLDLLHWSSSLGLDHGVLSERVMLVL